MGISYLLINYSTYYPFIGMFNQSESGLYKILSALDQTKCFTVSGKAVVLDNYKAAPNQQFNIYDNNGKFALVNSAANLGLWIAEEGSQDGAALTADGAQHKSTYFEIAPVKNGQFVGLGFYIKSFCSKVLDVFEGRTTPGTQIIQWSFHGNDNQIWLIVPADEQPTQINTVASLNAFQEVPAVFAPTNGQAYKVLSALNTTKALTVANTADRELKISDYVGDPAQKFMIFQNANKFALVVQSYNEGLCVLKDSKENGGQVKSDAGQHPSSWFEVSRVAGGEWSNKAYKIKTFAGQKALDVFEGRTENGTRVVQYSEHNNTNQIWLIVPTDQPIQKYESKSKGQEGHSIFGVNLPNINLPGLPNINLPKFG